MFSTTNLSTRSILTNGNNTVSCIHAAGQALTAVDWSGSSGKVAAEFTVDAIATGANGSVGFGWVDASTVDFNLAIAQGYAFTERPSNTSESHFKIKLGSTHSLFGSPVSAGDVITIYLDLDNGFGYLYINGIAQNGADPTSGAAGTGNMWDFPTGATYYIVVAPNNPNGVSSQITINSPHNYVSVSGYTDL